MKKFLNTAFIFVLTSLLLSETLFEVKDSSNNKVLDVSTDGLRVMNEGDTLMVISSEAIRANIGMTNKGLSRAFSVTTTQSKGKGLINALEVDASSATMTSPDGRYTDFSPLNLFLGLNSGMLTEPNPNPFNPGDQTTWEGKFNIFIGNESGRDNTNGYFNLFVGDKAGQSNDGGQKNTFIGSQSGQANVSGGYNTFLGYNSGIYNTGNMNVYIGADTGFFNGISGAKYYNTYLGTYAGEYFIGNSNTFLGCYAGRNSGIQRTGDGNVFIGYSAGSSSGNISNSLYIANSGTNTPLIKGTFPNTDLTFTANSVSVVHPMGETVNGLKIQTTYSGNTDSWHFYQQTDDELGLYYNTSLRGSFNITSGAYTSVSDRKSKKNIQDVGKVKEKLLKLSPKRYNFVTQDDSEEMYIGLIAQEVKELFPEFVLYHEESDSYTMDYAGMSVVAIQAIKEQQSEIDDLRREIIELKGLIIK